MAKLWITYAWADNEAQDVDYLAQELGSSGLKIKLDRWNLGAGKRLWEQIEKFICSSDECDAWVLVATENSLASEPCKEEFAYALDRALKSRGRAFPVIGLFLSDVDDSLIPAGIRTRLFVSVTDPDWKERIVAAAEGRQHVADRPNIEPYFMKVHAPEGQQDKYAIEVRPRAGVWAPFIAAVPMAEKEALNPSIVVGPRGLPTGTGMLTNCGSGPTPDEKYWVMNAGNQATPTMSYYIWCNKLPTELIFGVNGGKPQFHLRLGAFTI
ncbi:toll/interleukin-1 receptor domain-containing protein [Algiphilus sp.]|uniref:toll/interleukin-1 receptor domain-containing protein n=1 Tax=Algiphilus sp. TaxID=1872431 RepID=UPI003B5163B3